MGPFPSLIRIISLILWDFSVQNGLKSPIGMSFSEFSYQFLQARAFTHLYRYIVDPLQIGGVD
jgi:tyrosyl-tRNA synthetase